MMIRRSLSLVGKKKTKFPSLFRFFLFCVCLFFLSTFDVSFLFDVTVPMPLVPFVPFVPMNSMSPVFVCGLQSSRFTKEFDEELLESQWEEGDEEEDLSTLEWKMKQEMTSGSRGSGGGGFPPGGSASSPKMMFVELDQGYCESLKKNKVWTKSDSSQLGIRLKEQLLSGGLDTDSYSIEEFTLLSKCEAKDANAVKNFLLTQPEIAKVTLDSKDYYPKQKTNKSKTKKITKKQDPNLRTLLVDLVEMKKSKI